MTTSVIVLISALSWFQPINKKGCEKMTKALREAAYSDASNTDNPIPINENFRDIHAWQTECLKKVNKR